MGRSLLETHLLIFCPLILGEDLLLHGEVQSPLHSERPVVVHPLWDPGQGLLNILVLVDGVITQQP